MSQELDCTQLTSKKLSEVLSDIGLNDRIVMKRKRTCLMQEFLIALPQQLNGNPDSLYLFGSQSEGTTTQGLLSDADALVCHFHYHAIQEKSEWKPGVLNYWMIQDETVSPGYCLLQLLRKDGPDPETNVPNEQHFRDRSGRILLRNTVFRATTTAAAILASCSPDIHGPAHVLSKPGFIDRDLVESFKCKSWPNQAEQWDGEGESGEGQWPSKSMKINCRETGCFVVPVGSKCSKNNELEWRVSTSLAERYLMFSLNITQIRCYVLMKMLLKTCINEDSISSFMCKTVLFQKIATTPSNMWTESQLIQCLFLCLTVLYAYVLTENCPHFIIPKNNLMAGQFTRASKAMIVVKLMYIMGHLEETLLAIDCDDLGKRIRQTGKFNSKNSKVSSDLSFYLAFSLNRAALDCLLPIRTLSYKKAIKTLLSYIFKLNYINHQDHEEYQKACMLLTPWFYTALGSVLASQSIEQEKSISANALAWISMGLNTDVSSSKLKQASMFYCVGNIQRTENLLKDTEEIYDTNKVEPTCQCHVSSKLFPRRGFIANADNTNEEALQYISASCVKFLQCEINCVPRELRFEMFRCTNYDLSCRDQEKEQLAAVDSLPYLYFLQYKTYSHLSRQDEKQRALSNLLKTIKKEKNLGHKDIALNLLGQCMEEEDRVNDALHYYSLSLRERKRSNAAEIHICRLLSKLVNDTAQNNYFCLIF